MRNDVIEVRGARQNTLAGVDLDVPKWALVVFTGVSGSGKSSLVFGTIAAESQRLINETYTAFLQSLMPALPRPDVDRISGLNAVIMVDQERMGANSRSTLGLSPMRWTEIIDIDRPLPQVQRAIADEHQLMQWSAWPAATGYTCSVDGDGTSIGSAIVFRDSAGVDQGRQRLTSVTPQRVEYRLRNRGPAGRDMRPEVDFRLDELTPGTTRVHLDFRNQVPLPPPLRQLAGLVIGRKVRALHIADLRLLKAHVEQTAASPA